jgi:hypothetical protein
MRKHRDVGTGAIESRFLGAICEIREIRVIRVLLVLPFLIRWLLEVPTREAVSRASSGAMAPASAASVASDEPWS